LCEVIATVGLPAPQETLKFTAELAPQIHRELYVPIKNTLLEKAKLFLMEKEIPGSTKGKNDTNTDKPGKFNVDINSPFFPHCTRYYSYS